MLQPNAANRRVTCWISRLLARVPSPNKTIEELAKVSPQLPTLLPGLASMLSADPVSPLFAQLYDTKVRMLRENLGRLDLLLVAA